MHHHRVALFLHPPEQLAHPTLADAHPFSRFPLRHFPVSGSFQPVQPVPLLLAHRDSFHSSAFRLSIGTFYLAQLGTFHLAAMRVGASSTLCDTLAHLCLNSDLRWRA